METDELVTLAEVGRRVGLSAQRVRQLAETDPKFPRRQRAGGYWLVSWAAAKRYFDARNPQPGRPPRAPEG